MDERGVECHWRFTSDLHIANVFPSAARRLMRRSLERFTVRGVDTTLPFLKYVFDQGAFAEGKVNTMLVETLIKQLRTLASQAETAHHE